MKIIIPTNLEDISLKQWVAFQKNVNQDMTEDAIAIHLVSIFCNIPLEDVLTISAKDFKSIVTTISKAIEQQPIFKQRFNFKGVEYGMIPNFDKISAGEYIDLDKYYSTDPIRFMSILFRPIKNKVFDTYTIEKYKGSNNDFDLLPVSYYLGANVFFYSLKNELLRGTKNYFQQLKPKDKEQLDLIWAKSGVGINQFLLWLTEISTNLKKQQT